MKDPAQFALGSILAGFVIAAVICIAWAISMMDLRDWCYFTLLTVLFVLLIYGRAWLRRLFGIPRSAFRAPRWQGQPRFLRLSHTRPPANGRAPHPTRNPKLETRNR